MPKYEAAYPKDPDEAVSRCRPENQDLIKSIYTIAHEKYEICQGMEVCLAMEYIRDHLTTWGNGFIEIGSAYGGSFHCWASIITGGPAISVDKAVMAKTLKHGITTPNDTDTVARRNQMWKENFPGRIFIVDGYSQEPTSIAAVKFILKGRKVDYLFIDGDHSEEITRLDWQNYSQFVRPGGLVGFHDVYHPVHQHECGKFFRELPNRKWETGRENHCRAHTETGIGIAHID